MTSAQRQRSRRGASGPDPASRGFILVIVAVVLGAILLAAGGNVGFDEDDESVDIGDREAEETTTTGAPTDTTAPATSATVPPAEVKVVAANGAGISGLAGATTDFLATQGYSNSEATDAPGQVSATVVYFAEGFQPNAAALAEVFGLPEAQVQPLPPEPVANTQPADSAIVIVVGPDAETVVSGEATTTTTAAPG